MTEQLIVGLTGGIGSGKSAASDAFENLGIQIIDTDKISHLLTSINSDCLDAITNTFGSEIIENGQLNRAKLRRIIFGDDLARNKLENILHPRIRQKVEEALSEVKEPYAIIVVPLLVEKKKYEFINRILVIDCDEQIQINRVKKRNNLNDKEVADIMRTQATRQQRLVQADDIIHNNGDLSLLLEQVKFLNKKYVEMSSKLKNSQK
jgi:dephospho-CoA kinase